MNVTKQMLDAAMRKAVEAGLLPRSALRHDSFADREVIRLVLEAAATAGDLHQGKTARKLTPSWRRFIQPDFFPQAHMACWQRRA